VSIGGNLMGGSVSGADSSDSTGYIYGQSIASVFIGGSIISGKNTGTGTLTGSGSIQAAFDIGQITVNGSLVGNLAVPVIISARGQMSPTTTDVAIAGLSVGGNVAYANILAGYNTSGHGVDGSAGIGDVSVTGSWATSNLVAGVQPGPDGLFGTADDTPIATSTPNILSQIASVTIGGKVFGTPATVNSADHFGFVSQYIISFEVSGVTLPLQPGPHNDSIPLVKTGDVTLLEV
jgi:hypothetical protein